MSGGQDWAAELIDTSGGDMSDMTIQEFCDLHNACCEGRGWAIKNCRTMADVWQTAKPEWLMWVATRQGVLDDRTVRLFACWCVRQVWHLLADERSRQVVFVAERFAVGEATEQELVAARDAALVAAWDAAWDAARDAAWAAALLAAREAALVAALVAARDAARDAARAAALVAAREAAWAAARKDQAGWLRLNARPSFERVEAI